MAKIRIVIEDHPHGALASIEADKEHPIDANNPTPAVIIALSILEQLNKLVVSEKAREDMLKKITKNPASGNFWRSLQQTI